MSKRLLFLFLILLYFLNNFLFKFLCGKHISNGMYEKSDSYVYHALHIHTHAHTRPHLFTLINRSQCKCKLSA